MSPLPRAARALPWLLGVAVLLVLWRKPGLVQDLRLLGRGEPAPEEQCELAAGEPCVARFADGLELSIQVESAPLRPGQPAGWTVRSSDSTVRLTGIELTGVSMPMGLTLLPLKVTGASTWTAEGALPSCGGAAMMWRADVAVESASGPRIAAFQFWTEGDETSPSTPPRGAGRPDAPEPGFGDFTLTTRDGPLRLSDLRGQVVLLYFGYTACPDICPTTMATLGSALRKLSPEQQAQVTGLLVSLDPARDGLERLMVYSGHFHERFRGGTASEAELDTITADWDISWRVTPLSGSAMSYAVDHPTHSLLVGRDGRVIKRLAHGSSSDEVAADIAAALADAPTATP